MRMLARLGALIGAGLIIGAASTAAHANRWGRDYVPNLAVVTQDGKTLRFYDDVVHNKRLVISFIFTSCRDMCPLITARLTQVYERLGEAAGRDIQFVSISVDPDNDTPQKMKEHADAFHVGPGWLFLTGTKKDITAIRHKLGDRATNLLDHRQEIWLVNGSTSEWQRESAFGDLAQVVHNIRAMDPALRLEKLPAPKRVASGGIVEQPGQALFAKACAACHTIGEGERVGPDLAGVSQRRDKAWLLGFIATPQRYHAQQDPIALALAEKYKGVRMPNLGLNDRDAADLVAYMEARTYAAESPAPAGHDHAAHGHAGQGATPQKAKAAARPTPKAHQHH